ncbi:GL12575 [Drosophila persimilis]|uniref:GL12575 n=1 Tax=Drosophila persimilis TaxID=7234 RepID=B4GLI7_DROPE|nr:GL12575 [Drosophila persimilis]
MAWGGRRAAGRTTSGCGAAAEKFSLSATPTTSTTLDDVRTCLKCAHVQKCHCFGFGRKQSVE